MPSKHREPAVAGHNTPATRSTWYCTVLYLVPGYILADLRTGIFLDSWIREILREKFFFHAANGGRSLCKAANTFSIKINGSSQVPSHLKSFFLN